MTTSDSETRRASATFQLRDGEEKVVREGSGDAFVTDDAVTVGDVTVEFLDADGFTARDWSITLDLFPSGRLVLSQLGRRFETFAHALQEARGRARLAGLLAHGIEQPQSFRGALVTPKKVDGEILVYPTHLAFLPENDDPFQIPFGAIQSFSKNDSDWTVVVKSDDGAFAFGQLARETERFREIAEKALAASRNRFREISGNGLFSDGTGVALSKAGRDLLERWTPEERRENVSKLLSFASSDPFVGLVTLLDPDERSESEVLPPDMAAFLLVPAGRRVALEILGGPSAATYVFEGDLVAINRDLRSLHFRRRPLSFTEDQLKSDAARPYRLAFRKLQPLARLRSATQARVIHNDAWNAAAEKAFL